MLNVLMFCSRFCPTIGGGAERQAAKLAVSLAKAGCRVTILARRFDLNPPDREEVNGVIIERLRLIDLALRYPVPGVALFNIPYMIWQIVRAVRPCLRGADILHCHNASLLTAGAALAGRMARVPVLCKAATAHHRSDLGRIEQTGASGRLVAWLVRSLVGTWIATTAAVEEALIRAGVQSEKIARIPNGVELADDPRGPANRVKRFLYLGRISASCQRDLPTLIRAFDRLATTHAEVELAIVGNGDLFAAIQQLAQTCAARYRIHLPGYDRPEKWLAWADCFVLPSRREGLSNALLEAMAAGLPCIANDIPPNREVLANGEAGILVPVEDLDALEKAMRDVTDESRIAEHYARRAQERVAHCYSIRAVATQHMNLYQSRCTRGYL